MFLPRHAPLRLEQRDDILRRRGFGDIQIGAGGELHHGIARPGIAGKEYDPIGSLEPVRIGLVFAVRRRARLEVPVRILDRDDFNVGVLIDQPGLDIVKAWKVAAIGRCLPSAQRISAFGVR